jgi:DNA-binding transcriptional regulator Cro
MSRRIYIRKAALRAPTEDAALKEAAVQKAGGIAQLAKVLGVTAGAVSQWARTRPIPRHARARLEHYIQTVSTAGDEPTRRPSSAPPPNIVTWLSHFLGSGPVVDAGRSSRLTSRDQRRLLVRIEEVQNRLRADLERLRHQVTRELSEYQRLLQVESPSRHRKQRGSGQRTPKLLRARVARGATQPSNDAG